MSDAILVSANKVRFLKKYGHWAVSLLIGAMGIGAAKGKYWGVEGRVDAVEQTHPEATAAGTRRNTDELTALRLRVDGMASEVSATRVDVARLCVMFELKPTPATNNASDAQVHP